MSITPIAPAVPSGNVVRHGSNLCENSNPLRVRSQRNSTGSETRQYVERTAGESEVTQQTSYAATGSGGYRDAQHADVRRVSRVDWKDLRGLIEGEAIILFGNRRVHAKLFYAKIDPRGRLRRRS